MADVDHELGAIRFIVVSGLNILKARERVYATSNWHELFDFNCGDMPSNRFHMF